MGGDRSHPKGGSVRTRGGRAVEARVEGGERLSEAEEALNERVAAWARGQGINLDRVQRKLLHSHARMVLNWNRRIRLTGAKDMTELLLRHTCDSLVAAGLLPEEGGLLDVGSGAGFPGVPLAIVRPGLKVVLAESVAKRAGFLSRAVDELPGATVVRARLEGDPAGEGLAGGAFDHVVARAVRLEELLGVAGAYLVPGGRALYWAAAHEPREEWLATADRLGYELERVLTYRLPQGEEFSVISWVER